MAETIDVLKKSFARRNSVDSAPDWCKLPPQVQELEEAVLGALMIESTALKQVEAFLVPEMFYVDANQRICRAILCLCKLNRPVDLLTVTEQLKKNAELDAAGGAYYVTQLTNKVSSSANISDHIRIVFEKWMSRRMIMWATDLIKDSYEDTTDIFELRERAELEWRVIQNSILTGQVEDLETQIDEAVKLIERQMDGKGAGVPSKHAKINEHFGGWQKQTLNIIGARPGVGKSSFLISELMFSCENHKQMVFSIEPSKKQFFSRCLSNISNVPNSRVKNRTFYAGEEMAWYDAVYWLKQRKHNLTVDFVGGIQIEELCAKVRKVNNEKGIDALWIDYLQQIKPTNPKANRDEQVGEVTRALKALAKNEDIAIIALASLNRKSEEKADKKPTLIDLRESGNIESDADTVSFLLRPEMYFPKNSNGDIIYNGEQEQFKGICQWFCEKNRDDKVFEEEFECNLGTNNFKDSTPF